MTTPKLDAPATSPASANQKRSRQTEDAPSRLQRLVIGRRVHIFTCPPQKLEDKHGYTKQGHGRHYIQIGIGKWGNPGRRWVDKAWDRRCDASRWAKRAGAKKITHWYQI